MQPVLVSILLAGLIVFQSSFTLGNEDDPLAEQLEDSFHDVAKRTAAYSYRYQYNNHHNSGNSRQCIIPGAPKHGLTWYQSRTVGSIVIHSCKPGYVLKGARIRTCQANGHWSRELPTCADGKCPDPGKPENSIRFLSSTSVNSIVKYKCNEGFRLSGSSYRVCQANGKWSGVAAKCTGTSCEVLSNPSDGTISVPSRTVGSTATYSCNTGFNLVGGKTRVCRAGGVWSGKTPDCQAVDCGRLSNPQNGAVSFKSTVLGSDAVYSCNSGFTLVGAKDRKCQANGSWSKRAPICRVLSCGRLDSPVNGKVVLSGSTPGSVATYSCNGGFMLSGDERRKCQSNGKWTGVAATCRAVICDRLVAPSNGIVTLSSSSSSQRPGDTATYSCNNGFVLSNGDRVRVCQQDMTYTGTAPSCVAVVCELLRDPPNGRVRVSGSGVGSIAGYSCNRGFVLNGNTRRTCSSNGQYDGREPSCRPVDCGQLDSPRNGRVFVTTSTFGGTAKYSCNEDFELQGDKVRRCGPDGSWTGSAPRCTSVGCGQLPDPLNGQVDISDTIIGSFAVYTCNQGFVLIGQMRRVCQRTAQWSGNTPSCQPITCETLQPPQSGTVSVTGSTPGATARYSCDNGFLLVGLRDRLCQGDGTYTGQAPVCQRIRCEQLSDPVNGQVSISGDNTPGSVATYSCNQGFRLDGVTVRSCDSDGTYSGQAPVCREIDCGPLNSPSNGRVQFSSSAVGSLATYSCDNGYSLVGVSQRICRPSMEWSGDEPTCVIVDCGVLPEPLFGTVIFTSTTFQSTATYSCNDGFQLSNFVTRVCQANGRYSLSAPICQPINCQRLDNPNNGFIVVRGNTIGAIATYTCNPGFELIGQKTRECQDDGSYTGQAPTCEAINCGTLLNPQNGFVKFGGDTVGVTASYVCDKGFTLRGSVVRVCLPNGEWSGQEPTCFGIDCGPLDAPDNGAVNFVTSNVESIARYQCNSGFVLVGENTRTCLLSGVWSDSDPICQAVSCSPLDFPENGFVRFTSTDIGSTASYMCNPGFQIQGAETRICLQGGEWSAEAPICLAVFCGPLTSPKQGSVVITGTGIEAVATYTCDNGFNIVGKSTRVCSSQGVWSGQEPSCQAQDCGYLDNPQNGIVDASGTAFWDTATYRCDDGYQLIGEAARTCEETGLWSGSAPYCAPVDCGPLDAPVNSRIILTGTVINSRATYSCFPGYELVGDETRLCSANGQWTGLAPFCKATECGPLFDPAYGSVTFTDIIVYSMATYKCDSGFGIKGALTRMCQKDGTWSGSDPTCEPSDCGPLQSPIDGMVDTSGTTFGATATYSCMPGFYVIGEATRTCDQSGVWSGVSPICQPVDCGVLNSPAYGRVEFTSTVFRANAMYSCNFGFQLIGERNRMCQDNGAWSGDAPICQRISCSQLIAPSNGRLELSNGVLAGSIAKYFCFPGFNLDGNIQRTCQESMEWTGSDPFCRAENCDLLDNPLNGQVSFTSTSIGSIASYTCSAGFRLTGAITRECLQERVWSGIEPTCERIECLSLDAPQYGSVATSAGYNVGSIATYSCNPDFVLSDSTTRECLPSGEWSGFAPICRAIDCGPLPQPANGAVRVSGTNFGESARYSCSFGFILQGVSFRVCQIDGTWSNEAPVCVESQCSDLSDPDNGRVLVSGRIIGSIATYDCNEGFELQGGSSTRVCRDNQEWSGTTPTCRAVDCGVLFSPLNGRVTFSSTTFESVASYTCNPGFDLVGITQRTCQKNGAWSGQEPSCSRVIVECPTLVDPVNGDVALSGNTPGSSASYTCISGYIVDGNDFRFCQSDGTWTGTDPICRPTNCPTLPDLVYGTIQYIGSGFGAIVRYRCDPGYDLIGVSSRTCKSDGTWSGSDPTCVEANIPPPITSCGDPGTPANGVKTGNSYAISAVVYYECNTGYLLSGDSTRTCRFDGQWTGSLPSCTKNDDECYGSGRVFDSCGRACQCVNGKFVECCRYRRDFASYTDEDKQQYIDAVLRLSSDPTYQPRYYALLEKYRSSFDTDVYNSDYAKSQFFVWNRYFLLEYENLLQEINCRITLPFYDWTVLPLSPYISVIWNDNLGFGKSVRSSDNCLIGGPFKEGDYSLIPSAGSGCLKREFKNQKFPSRSVIERDILTQPASEFNKFHRHLQLYIHTSVRCFIGGTMCGKDAANDPVFILHLTMLDYIYDRWQGFGNDRLTMRYAGDTTPLILAPEYTVTQYHNNKNLPNNVAVCYAEPNVKSHIPTGHSFLAQSFSEVAKKVDLTMGCLSRGDLTSHDLGLSEEDIKFMESKSECA